MRRAQEQLHSQGMSVTVGSLDCALARAFGLTGSLAELGWQPRDLAPVQVRSTKEGLVVRSCLWVVVSAQHAGAS